MPSQVPAAVAVPPVQLAGVHVTISRNAKSVVIDLE
jgi:hypothetical protein